MGQTTPSDEVPEDEATGTSADANPCLSCRGRGRKFVTLRRLVGAAGGAAETDLLRQTRMECLACSGSGRGSAA
jgi:hypothetical protein